MNTSVMLASVVRYIARATRTSSYCRSSPLVSACVERTSRGESGSTQPAPVNVGPTRSTANTQHMTLDTFLPRRGGVRVILILDTTERAGNFVSSQSFAAMVAYVSIKLHTTSN